MTTAGFLVNETIVTFSEAGGKTPRFRGKRIHPSTFWRWHRKGLDGVHLEALRIGGRYVTSLEAIERFSVALAEREIPSKPTAEIAKPATTNQRQRSIEESERRLQRAGIL